MTSVIHDLVHSARSLRKSPGFAVTAIITIALGIGVSAAIFSVVNAILLRPLSYEAPERLVHIWGDMRNRNVVDFPFPPGDYHDLRQQADLFEGLAAIQTGRQALLGDNGPEQIVAAAVTPNVFDVFGIRVALGRNFQESDGTPQPPPPANASGAPAAAAPALPA
jgi:hypothetical protein